MILQRLKRLFLKPISGIPLTISLVFFSPILIASLFDLTFLNYFLSLCKGYLVNSDGGESAYFL